MLNNNAQKKALVIQTINTIFENILKDLQNYSVPEDQKSFYDYQRAHLMFYKEALINEVNARNETCDHPIRAAFALKKLHNSPVDEFQDNLNNFKYQSQHSGFYPTTRKIANFLAGSILLGASI